jgi:hypothetical protein
MILSDEAAAVDKLFGLADKFRMHYDRREWSQAMAAYHTANISSVFLAELDNEADRQLLKELFGHGNGPGEDIKGAFNRDMVQRAHIECIKKDIVMPYTDLMGLLHIMGKV